MECDRTIEHALDAWTLDSGAVLPSMAFLIWALGRFTPLPCGVQDTASAPLPDSWIHERCCPLPCRVMSTGTWRFVTLGDIGNWHGPHAGLSTASQRLCLKEVKPGPGSKSTLSPRFKDHQGSPICHGLGRRWWEGGMPGWTSPDPAQVTTQNIGPVTRRRVNPAFIRPK